MSLAAVSLDDKYTLESGRVFLNGVQALVRLPIMQRWRDQAQGLETAGFVSGYRGSPLGGYDQALWQARSFLEENHVRFQPGLNEDMAATSVWGSQQVGLFPGAKYDGVFGIWYGKGPGVDRSGDVIKHGNIHGTSPHGGVLVMAGDDHGAGSSTHAHQSDHAFTAAMIPVLNPASVQEYLDFGLLGFAMSRFSGLWVGFKMVAEALESSASVYVDPGRVDIRLPDFEIPEGGLGIRWPEDRLEIEKRVQNLSLPAALAFARANGFDQTVIDGPRRRLGIVATGKSYLDVRQALGDLGIDEGVAAEIGLSVYKVGLSWPLDGEGARAFAQGLEEILVVEEKRPNIEIQLKDKLYDLPEAVRPRVVGKHDEEGRPLITSIGELSPGAVAKAIAGRLGRFHSSQPISERLTFLEHKEQSLKEVPADVIRMPYFCSGCPHNTSTRVPDGSFAMAGIGCHTMAVWMNRSTMTFTHMGGEGANWIGIQPFTDSQHVFQNMGDGTYYHSGLMAIRASVAAESRITYKILFNDAVAMTGGQPVEGQITVPQIAAQVHAEGIKQLVVVSDEPDKYPAGTKFPPHTQIHHRQALDEVQRQLRDVEGVTVLIYDQTCAAEKRRRRKRGLFPDPPKRALINEAVCEGCGDCNAASNCLSVEPLETEFGRKRSINQSSCNKDFSCVLGFCPSFVTVHGGALRKATSGGDSSEVDSATFDELPEPDLPALDDPYGVMVAGVGGTGVVTIGALLGMAAHLEGKGITVLDQTGLSQKGGGVLSHVRIAAKPDEIHAVRLTDGGADAVIGCDMLHAASFQSLAKMQGGVTRAVINSQVSPSAAHALNPDFDLHTEALEGMIIKATGDNLVDFVDASGLATALMGDAIATNLFMLGYAYQRGMVPLGGEAIQRAIELNGVAVEDNLKTFRWGRTAAFDLKRVEAAARPTQAARPELPAKDLDSLVARRVTELTKYQDAAYAGRYSAFVAEILSAEQGRAKGLSGLAEAVARNYFKLLAYKDEYEVARLHSDPEFRARIERQFEGDFSLRFHMAPPLLARRDPKTGRLLKREYGSWMMGALGFLAGLKGLRGGPFDIFGRTAERRRERALIVEYEVLLRELTAGLDAENHALACEIAALPEMIRGFGHVKEANISDAKAREAELMARFRDPGAQQTAAE
ncbi:MAG TPA: indolepyruvate ferredoxin oxidoreductase family protein [Alphaproteobacteria bacterium]|nr:indolepyruvate ferredoxin oxidoreductase family protein [Alphaproteobacteria bacterium]